MINQHQSKFTANSDNIKADYSNFPKIGEVCRFSPENNRLQAGDFGHIFASTTTNNGHRTRQTCGFFVSQICQNHGITTPVIHSEFAIRLISRNKAETIRTNKASRLLAVVETVSHPFSDISIQPITKLTNMTYKFLTQFNNRQLTITVTANSYAEALSRIQWQQRPVCIVRNLKTKGGVYA